MPISHVLIKAGAGEHAAVVDFYDQALKPLGYRQLRSFPNGMTGFGDQSPDWWVGIDDKNSHSTVHVAFRAPGKACASVLRFSVQSNDHLTSQTDSAAVDACHAAAVAAGAKDNGAPGLRAAMDPKYYAAFIFDPVGNNIEVGCMVEN
jgi:hypothetical protein